MPGDPHIHMASSRINEQDPVSKGAFLSRGADGFANPPHAVGRVPMAGSSLIIFWSPAALIAPAIQPGCTSPAACSIDFTLVLVKPGGGVRVNFPLQRGTRMGSARFARLYQHAACTRKGAGPVGLGELVHV